MADLKNKHIDNKVKQGFYLDFERSQQINADARIQGIWKEDFLRICFEVGYETFKTMDNYELFEKHLHKLKEIEGK